MHKDIKSNTLNVEQLKIHYLEAGQGEPVVFLHGWPTSSFLWRNILPKIAQTHRAIALDLPGFGFSDKPLEATYNFRFYENILKNVFEQLGLEQLNLVVHDLGGPVGLYWAVNHPQQVKRLVCLNTLVYPELSWAVKLFMLATFVPLVNSWIATPKSIKRTLQLGTKRKNPFTEEMRHHYCDPFQTKEAQKVLLKTVQHLSVRTFQEVAQKVTAFEIPVRLIYGENDLILPDVKNTMHRLKTDLPQAQISSIPKCGHFLQEDDPETVALWISEFLNSSK